MGQSTILFWDLHSNLINPLTAGAKYIGFFHSIITTFSTFSFLSMLKP